MGLVELLVGMVILTIVTTMVILTWTSLQNSYSYTLKSSEARSTARDTMERLRREIRDIQAPEGELTITLATANKFCFMTAFNDPGTDGNGRMRLVQYLYVPSESRLWRQADDNHNGLLDDATRLLASNVVNGMVPNTTNPTPVFKYYAATGAETSVLTKIVTVQIRLITDVNPSHAPAYFDLVTTVQPRNLPQL